MLPLRDSIGAHPPAVGAAEPQPGLAVDTTAPNDRRTATTASTSAQGHSYEYDKILDDDRAYKAGNQRRGRRNPRGEDH